METRSFFRFIFCLTPLWLVVACSGPPEPPPSLDELRNATFSGLDRGTRNVTLRNGVWADSVARRDSSRMKVQLVDDFLLSGDLDSNGTMEAIVLLTETFGGAELYTYMAAATREDGKVTNPGTEMLGDRTQVRGIRIEDGTLYLEIVEAAPFDQLCCPGELVTKVWKLLPKGFALQTLRGRGRMSPEIMGESEWVLEQWNPDDPLKPGTEVTLTYQENRFSGKSGCNQYSAGVTKGMFAGDISVGPPVSTRMACPESTMTVESRFLKRLENATRFGFLNGRLAITTSGDDTVETLIFSKRVSDQSGTSVAVKPE